MIDINIGIIAVQLISFAAAVFVLWKIAWKPVIAFMESRKNKIEDDINKAQESRENAIKLENSYKNELSEINNRAKEIFNKAQAEGNIFKENIIREAHEEARKIIESAKKDIGAEKEKIKKELQNEALDLSILISEKILKDKININYQEKIVNDFIEKLKNER